MPVAIYTKSVTAQASAKSWSTSAWGCPPIADTSNPQAGPDASAKLQALADLGQSGPLEIVVDQPLLCSEVKLHPGTTVRGIGEGSYLPGGTPPTAGLWMKVVPASGAGSTDSCALRNANWRSNYNSSSPSSSSLYVSNVVDRDIAIADLFVDGQARNYGRDPRINADGVYICPIRVHGCYNLRIENVFVYDPPCFHFAVSNIADAVFRNLRFLDPVQYLGPGHFANPSTNHDGLHFVGPWQDVEVDGLFGTTSDDFLPLNAAEGNLNPTDVYGPADTASGPHVWGGWGVVYYGHGVRLTARNLYPYNASDILRIQTGYDSLNGNPPNFVDHVLVENVVGSVVLGSLTSDAGSTTPQPGGPKSRVLLKGWALDLVDPTGASNVLGYTFAGSWGDVKLEDQRYGNLQVAGSNGVQAHQVVLLAGASIGRLELDGYVVREDSSEIAAPSPPVSIAQGTVDNLVIGNSEWSRNAGTNAAFAQVSGGAVNRIGISNTYCQNVANVLSITGGSVQNVDTTGISHRAPYAAGPAGGAAIDVGAGVTLGVLTSCGSDVANLVGTSAGAITTKKTDGTERGA